MTLLLLPVVSFCFLVAFPHRTVIVQKIARSVQIMGH
jgi:hypothetical protein